MPFVVLVIIGVFPGVFWLWMAYRWDKYQPEPKKLVIRTFLLGMAAVIPVAAIEWVMGLGGADTSSLNAPLAAVAYESFIVAGVTEELAKFLVVYFSIYKNRHFDESTDGIVYASAAALGFASLENVLYMIGFGWEVIILRSILSTLAHLLFAVIWGYPLALKKIRRPGAAGWVVLGLLGGMFAHGLYDFVLFTQGWFVLMVIPVMAGLIIALVLMVKHARKISAFRPKAGAVCRQCGQATPANANFCIHCGARVSGAAEEKKGG